MTKKEEKQIDNLICLLEMHHIDSSIIIQMKNRIKTQQAEIDFLMQERNYIKNNIEVDLNKRGIYSQAKGQIAQMLKCYTENDNQLNNILKGK